MRKIISLLTAAAMCTSAFTFTDTISTEYTANADEWYCAGETCEPLHDTSRDVQKEGVGNPLNFGERNTPADASTAEIRAINRKMTVQEVKYALYKEIDEHWDLISTRLGQTDREKMYALFLGLGSRESTLGGDSTHPGSDHETAYEDGWGVNSAHAYGTLQTAVTAFAGCDPTFMPEDNVPEMFQYDFTESNFYDCIISNHMGIRKILHFAEICINNEGMHGYQVVRNSLKGFNTGWCYMAEDDGAYKTYADEICSMAQFYYNEGHLYDNVFTWTSAGGEMEKYRTADRWDWWGDGEPSMAPIEEKQQTETTTTTTTTTAQTNVTTTRTSVISYVLTNNNGTDTPLTEILTEVVYITDPNTNTTTTTTTTATTEKKDAIKIYYDYINLSKRSYNVGDTITADYTIKLSSDADLSSIPDSVLEKALKGKWEKAPPLKNQADDVADMDSLKWELVKREGDTAVIRLIFKAVNSGNVTFFYSPISDGNYEFLPKSGSIETYRNMLTFEIWEKEYKDKRFDLEIDKRDLMVGETANIKFHTSQDFENFTIRSKSDSIEVKKIDDNTYTATAISASDKPVTVWLEMDVITERIAVEGHYGTSFDFTVHDEPFLYGDANCDNEVNIADAVLIMQSISNPAKYGVDGTDANKITAAGKKNADCSGTFDGITNLDALTIQKYMLSIIDSLPDYPVSQLTGRVE